jgi:hypothetical protein
MAGTQGYNKTTDFPLGRIMREKDFPRASDGRMNAGLFWVAKLTFMHGSCLWDRTISSIKRG